MESTPDLIDGIPVVPTTSARQILADARPELVAAVREVAATGTAMLSQVARRHRLTTAERDLLGFLAAEVVRTEAAHPAPGTPVTVTFPATASSPAETVTGVVTVHDHDSITIRGADGETFTMYHREQIAGRATVEMR